MAACQIPTQPLDMLFDKDMLSNWMQQWDADSRIAIFQIIGACNQISLVMIDGSQSNLSFRFPSLLLRP
jgi:hypothetical protein